jgi:hypothetical protein
LLRQLLLSHLFQLLISQPPIVLIPRITPAYPIKGPATRAAVIMLSQHSVAFSFLLMLLQTIAAYRSGVELPSPSTIDSQIHNELLDSFLIGQIHQPEVYSRAVTVLETLESAPSCHRVATLRLISSCQSLERTSSTEVDLYETREEYATKLAMCELSGAKATISSHCADFVPCARACPKAPFSGFLRRPQHTDEVHGKACYQDVTRLQVKQCISALHSKPQWWTSYSNALQNVVVVCQASRSAIEKGKSIVGTLKS